MVLPAPGRLEDGSEGSPLIAAKLAASHLPKSRHGVLHCINVEEDAGVFANLEEATADYVAKRIVKNHNGRFDEFLSSVLHDAEGTTAFFFIDPFGTEGTELETIRTIASRNGKTEILARYDDTRVKRLLMWAANQQESLDEAHRKTAEAFQARVAQLTDEQSAKVAQAALQSGEELDRMALIEGYARLVKATTSLDCSLSYPIRNPETRGHRYLSHSLLPTSRWVHSYGELHGKGRTVR